MNFCLVDIVVVLKFRSALTLPLTLALVVEEEGGSFLYGLFTMGF